MEITETLEHGSLKVTVTVRSKTGFDRYVERILFSRIYTMVTGQPYTSENWWTAETQAVDQITAVINRTVTVKGLPIQWANAQSDQRAICESYEYIKQIPATIWDAWIELLTKADQPPGDPDTFPPNELTDDKKKTPKS